MNTWRPLCGALLGLTLAGSAACGSRYETVDIKRVGGHTDARGSAERFTVPEGGLLVFELSPESINGSRDYDATDEVELRIAHPEVAEIRQGLAVDTWMLSGVVPGGTVVEIRINGEVEDAIPVEITAQEIPR